MRRPPQSRGARSVALATAALLAASGLASCGGDDDKPEDRPEPGPSASPPTGSRRASATLVQVSPLTGLPAPKQGLPHRRVFVVKIDNTSNGAPQTGVDQADLVVEELVEGGLTRLAAFFYSRTPRRVAHIRSVRATDIGLVKPIGGVLIASGGARVTVRRVRSAGVDLRIEDRGTLVLQRDPARRLPYNRILDLAAYAPSTGRAEPPKPYLPFRPATTAIGGKPAARFGVTFSGTSTTQWAYAKGTYQRQNGRAAPGQEFAADSVLVLSTRQGDAGYLDPAGNPVPETLFTGGGTARLFHGGTVVTGRWAKKSSTAALSLTTADGRALAVPAGHTWIELIPNGDGRVTIAR